MSDDTPSQSAETPNDDSNTVKLNEQEPVQTRHILTIDDEPLEYTAHTGMMSLKNDQGDTTAEIFFVAYLVEQAQPTGDRPLTFVFNGGPGSSSVWLHLGALGPKRVQMRDAAGMMPPPPYKLVDNEQSWLRQSDLVFIDPVGTGFSRAADPEKNQDYWDIEGDIEAVGEFIRLFLTRHRRWSSPLFLAGESYGTTRAAGLAGHLIDNGIALNGVVLISTVLNMQTLRFNQGNDLPYALYVPTYAATAWYHKKLADDLQARDIADLLAEVEAWVDETYIVALNRGDRLSADDRQAIIETLARYTGLSETYIDQANLRVNIMHFCKELLRDDHRTVGRLDSRFTGRDKVAVGEMFEHDPSFSAIIPPYTAMLYDYVRGDLNYETDRKYEILSSEVNQKWHYKRGEYADTSDDLRRAFMKNPFMRVLVARGYYDLATPHFAAEYTLTHMGLDPDLRDNIIIEDYEAGHMMYLHLESLAKLYDDFAAFVAGSVPADDH